MQQRARVPAMPRWTCVYTAGHTCQKCPANPETCSRERTVLVKCSAHGLHVLLKWHSSQSDSSHVSIPVVPREASDLQQGISQGARARAPAAVCELIDDEGPLGILQGVYPIHPNGPRVDLHTHNARSLYKRRQPMLWAFVFCTRSQGWPGCMSKQACQWPVRQSKLGDNVDSLLPYRDTRYMAAYNSLGFRF